MKADHEDQIIGKRTLAGTGASLVVDVPSRGASSSNTRSLLGIPPLRPRGPLQRNSWRIFSENLHTSWLHDAARIHRCPTERIPSRSHEKVCINRLLCLLLTIFCFAWNECLGRHIKTPVGCHFGDLWQSKADLAWDDWGNYVAV